MTRTTLLAGLFLAAVLGSFAGELIHSRALAARNSSGTYSLPSGNPVVSGTTITSSWANGTLSDIGTEITNSLDRTGRGGMSGALKLANGTVGAPGLSFVSETGSGLYRNGSNDLRFSVAGADIEKWSPTTAAFPIGAVATGPDAGNGFSGTGGTTSGAGLYGTGGSPNGYGVNGNGTGTGAGVVGTGGTSNGYGGSFVGGATNGTGIHAVGTGTGGGGLFENGTAATGGTRQDAIVASNGDVSLDGVAAPTSTTAIKNRLTPTNIVKAWVNVTGNGPTINGGFNVASASCGTNVIQVNLAQSMASSAYAATCSSVNADNVKCNAVSLATGSFSIACFTANTGSQVNLCSVTEQISCIAVGAQ